MSVDTAGNGAARALAGAVNLLELRGLARDHLSQQAYDYVAGGADDEVTVGRNRSAFSRWQLLPRMLVDVAEVDLGCELFGCSLSFPVGLAPTAFQGLLHPDADAASARGAARAGTFSTLSTLATCGQAEVAAASSAPLFFQLYCSRDRGVARALVERAADLGYRALLLTVDVPVLGRREADLRNRLELPAEARPRNLLELIDPGSIDDAAYGSALDALVSQLFDPSLVWQDLDWLRSLSPLPIVIKGLLTADDARRALDHGADGVVVSNHGGRQLDGVPASIEALPEIVDALDGELPVIVDSGFRRGTDVVKALALGARAVMIGRPYLWGLALGGEHGVARVLEMLREEIRVALALLGCSRLADLGRHHLRRAD